MGIYKTVIKPFLFLQDPEKVHYKVFNMVKTLSKVPGFSAINRSLFKLNNKELERDVFGLKFSNPVGLAAGFDKDAILFNELADFGFGFIEIGTLTPKGQLGNPKPRLFRLPEDNALINRMGFNNQGVQAAVERLKNKKTNIIIGGNIGKNTTTESSKTDEDYIQVFLTKILFLILLN